MRPGHAGFPPYVEAGPGVWVALARTPLDGTLAHRLTPGDRADARRLPPRRGAERLGARGLLRALLAIRFPEAATADVAYEPSGRPWLLGHPRLGVSVSHGDGAYTACVALDRAVGVDVQPPPPDVEDPLLRWCAPGRRQELTTLSPQDRATEFAWMWTVKEACGKALGTGVAGPALTLDIPRGARRGAWGPYRWVSLREHSPIPLSCAFSSVTRGRPR
ncbi:4'-phosphopantetheinyl transferase family protein [Streptomyces sp. NPDC057445]|uniref:4'-phosphopantetheinyl transferase family protein n=1 Tax=Streptomyces sp. NPDC057445 TaxID=3346136 RepID=UPI00369149F4